MCILTNKNFLKPIDKSAPVWYNIVRKRGEKPQEREVNIMPYQFQCTVFLADGKHVSQNEVCETAKEAIARAEAWVALGHKAVAYIVVVDYAQHKLLQYPLT